MDALTPGAGNLQARRWTALVAAWTLALGCAVQAQPQTLAATAADPTGAALLNHAEGTVALAGRGERDWHEVHPRRSLRSGDRLWTDGGARAEVQLGAHVLRVDARTRLSLENATATATQVALLRGSISASVARLAAGETFEVGTPNLALRATGGGELRVDVDPDAGTTRVRVLAGQATVHGEQGEVQVLRAGQRLTFRTRALERVKQPAFHPVDDFDRWASARSRGEPTVRMPVPATAPEPALATVPAVPVFIIPGSSTGSLQPTPRPAAAFKVKAPVDPQAVSAAVAAGLRATNGEAGRAEKQAVAGLQTPPIDQQNGAAPKRAAWNGAQVDPAAAREHRALAERAGEQRAAWQRHALARSPGVAHRAAHAGHPGTGAMPGEEPNGRTTDRARVQQHQGTAPSRRGEPSAQRDTLARTGAAGEPVGDGRPDGPTGGGSGPPASPSPSVAADAQGRSNMGHVQARSATRPERTAATAAAVPAPRGTDPQPVPGAAAQARRTTPGSSNPAPLAAQRPPVASATGAADPRQEPPARSVADPRREASARRAADARRLATTRRAASERREAVARRAADDKRVALGRRAADARREAEAKRHALARQAEERRLAQVRAGQARRQAELAASQEAEQLAAARRDRLARLQAQAARVEQESRERAEAQAQREERLRLQQLAQREEQRKREEQLRREAQARREEERERDRRQAEVRRATLEQPARPATGNWPGTREPEVWIRQPPPMLPARPAPMGVPVRRVS